MFLSRFFVRPEVRSTRRPQPARRPLIEGLEGRQLLSTFAVSSAVAGHHIGTNVVGQHIGMSIQGNHIGTEIVGQHIGMSIQGNHIGTSMVVGQHIGTSMVDAAVASIGGSARKH